MKTIAPKQRTLVVLAAILLCPVYAAAQSNEGGPKKLSDAVGTLPKKPAPGPTTSANEIKEKLSIPPSEVPPAPVYNGRTLATYEYADDAMLEKEKARLKTEKELLKAHKKNLKTEKKTLKTKVSDLEDQNAPAEEIEKAEENKELVEAELDVTKDMLTENRINRRDSKNFLITPFLAPSYTPEMGFLIAGGGLASFKTNRLDPKIGRSSVNMMGGWGTTGSAMLFLQFKSYWYKDIIRINNENWFKNMSDNYWGVGYDEAAQWNSPNDYTAYKRLWWSENLQAVFRLGIDNLYGGLNLVLNQTIASELNEPDPANPDPEHDENYMVNDPNFQKDGDNNFNSGLGVILQYDSRDVPINAFKGLQVLASATFFGDYLGSDNRFQLYELDYRHYFTLGKRPGSTLAWQIKTRWGVGDVPWPEMGMLGNPFDFRGYRWGRFRDKTTLLGVLEYRLQFRRIHPKEGRSPLSPHGAVVWAGIGSLGDTYADMTNWLPNVGVGYRLQLQPRMNVRVDWGFGSDTQAFYVNFFEAF